MKTTPVPAVLSLSNWSFVNFSSRVCITIGNSMVQMTHSGKWSETIVLTTVIFVMPHRKQMNVSRLARQPEQLRATKVVHVIYECTNSQKKNHEAKNL